MKKIVSLVLVLTVLTILVGCSCDSKKTGETKAEPTTVAWEKGESLFGMKLKEYADACKQSDKKGIKKKQKLSTGFGEVSLEKNLNKRIGYTFADLNGDGTEELLVSLVDTKDKLNNYLIAVYQYTGDGIKRVLEGWSKNTYYLMNENLILNEASGGEDDAEIAKLHMRETSFEYVSTLSIKYGKKHKINYLYAEVGKPENTKEFKVSKNFWQEKCKEWENQVNVNNVKMIKDFK